MAARSIDQEQQQQVQMSNLIEGGHTATPSGHKTLLRNGALIQYILDTSVYPRELAPLRELRKMTTNLPWNFMSVPADEGQFLGLLMKLINAKNTIELGVFTGYSLLSTALALPQDGKIIAMDIDRQAFELGLPYIKKAGVLHKIDFREGQAFSLLEELIKDKKNWGFFDFAFVDADKCNYLNYHRMLMKLVKVGGLIAYDNTLWNGTLVDDNNESFPDYIKVEKPFVLAFNKALSLDSRIDLSMVPIGDGISLCRKVL